MKKSLPNRFAARPSKSVFRLDIPVRDAFLRIHANKRIERSVDDPQISLARFQLQHLNREAPVPICDVKIAIPKTITVPSVIPITPSDEMLIA